MYVLRCSIEASIQKLKDAVESQETEAIKEKTGELQQMKRCKSKKEVLKYKEVRFGWYCICCTQFWNL